MMAPCDLAELRFKLTHFDENCSSPSCHLASQSCSPLHIHKPKHVHASRPHGLADTSCCLSLKNNTCQGPSAGEKQKEIPKALAGILCVHTQCIMAKCLAFRSSLHTCTSSVQFCRIFHCSPADRGRKSQAIEIWNRELRGNAHGPRGQLKTPSFEDGGLQHSTLQYPLLCHRRSKKSLHLKGPAIPVKNNHNGLFSHQNWLIPQTPLQPGSTIEFLPRG